MLYDRRGSATPEVARTVLQTPELIQAFRLTEAQREAIRDNAFKVMEHLVASLDSLDRLRDQTRSGQAKVDAGEVRIQAGGQVVDLPSVVNLKKDTEAFLYNAKLALRDIGELFEVFAGKEFGAKYHKAQEWAAQAYGDESTLARMLAEDVKWISQLIRFRNAVEHPETEPGGPLRVTDFSLKEVSGKLFVLEPMWSQGDHTGPIVHEMEGLQQSLLTLYEDLLVEFLLATDSPFAIYEIPEAERDPTIPKRLGVTLKEPIKLAENGADSV